MPTPLHLPYEFSSVLISTADVDAFGVDPEQTTLVIVDTDAFGVDPEQTTLVIVDTNPFGIDPEQTTLITTGLDTGP